VREFLSLQNTLLTPRPDNCIYDATNADRAKYAFDRGHQVASHTWAHLHLPTLSDAQITSEFSRSVLLLIRTSASLLIMMESGRMMPSGRLRAPFLHLFARRLESTTPTCRTLQVLSGNPVSIIHILDLSTLNNSDSGNLGL
jgi:hypothetical protein